MPHRIVTPSGVAESAPLPRVLPAWSGRTTDPLALGRLLGWQFLLGALVILVAIALPAPDESDEPYLLAVAAAGALIGIMLLLLPRPQRVVIDGALLVLVVLIAIVVGTARPMGLAPRARPSRSCSPCAACAA